MSRKKDPLKEIKNFWGDVVRDEEISIQHRLKASELLIKLDEGGASGDGEEKRVVIICGEDEL